MGAHQLVAVAVVEHVWGAYQLVAVTVVEHMWGGLSACCCDSG